MINPDDTIAIAAEVEEIVRRDLALESGQVFEKQWSKPRAQWMFKVTWPHASGGRHCVFVPITEDKRLSAAEIAPHILEQLRLGHS